MNHRVRAEPGQWFVFIRYSQAVSWHDRNDLPCVCSLWVSSEDIIVNLRGIFAWSVVTILSPLPEKSCARGARSWAAHALAVARPGAGLVLNTEAGLSADFSTADACVRTYQKEIASRVPKAAAMETLINDTRAWCFRAKDTLKPFFGNAHNSLWCPAGFVNSLRVPDDYDGLVAQVGSLAKYLADHPEQKNESLKVNVTATRANELYDALRAAKSSLDAQDAVLDTKHQEQDTALAAVWVQHPGGARDAHSTGAGNGQQHDARPVAGVVLAGAVCGAVSLFRREGGYDGGTGPGGQFGRAVVCHRISRSGRALLCVRVGGQFVRERGAALGGSSRRGIGQGRSIGISIPCRKGFQRGKPFLRGKQQRWVRIRCCVVVG